MRQFLIAAGLALMTSTAMAQSADQDFVDKAASSSLFEIQSSEIILADADANADVKQAAERIISDHKKATADLKAAAKRSDLVVPATLVSKDQSMIDALNGANSKVPTYLHQQIEAHEQAIALHQGYGSAGQDPNLKAYADATAPVLLNHLKTMRALEKADNDITTSSTASDQAAPAN